ncbi:CAP domain-containing protein, partial [Modestobacter sp. KNN46-3]|uniref:CAP domain-containing protein n=1 Tax=Modestobacter sp. KNN46-3 TaxID=2711218 RepID=UPI001F15534A
PPARAAPAPPAPAAPAAAPGPEGQVLALVNAERAAAGCAAVSADAGLAAVARAHSADMRDRDYFSHVTPEGLDPFARARAAGIGYARAENIASGQPDAAAVMAAWMSSPGHRQNILNCQLRTLGVGVAAGSGGPWWTQLFGA